MNDKKERGRLIVVKAPKGLEKEKPKFVSFMPEVSGVDNRRIVKEAFENYKKKVGKFLDYLIENIKEKNELSEDSSISMAIELYIWEKIDECYRKVSVTINQDIFNEFIRVANSGASRERMDTLQYMAKANFDDFSLQLNKLCERCGVETLGNDAEVIVNAYLQKVKELTR